MRMKVGVDGLDDVAQQRWPVGLLQPAAGAQRAQLIVDGDLPLFAAKILSFFSRHLADAQDGPAISALPHSPSLHSLASKPARAKALRPSSKQKTPRLPRPT